MIVCLCAILILAYILRNRKDVLAYFLRQFFFLHTGNTNGEDWNNRRHKLFYLCVIWEQNFKCLERKENFWRITLDYDQNVIIYFFQMRHEYFLSELTLLSVGIPPVYTGAAPSCRHTAAASATSAARAPPKAETAARSTTAALGAGSVA